MYTKHIYAYLKRKQQKTVTNYYHTLHLKLPNFNRKTFFTLTQFVITTNYQTFMSPFGYLLHKVMYSGPVP